MSIARPRASQGPVSANSGMTARRQLGQRLVLKAEPFSVTPIKNGVVPMQSFPTAFPNIAACSAAIVDQVGAHQCCDTHPVAAARSSRRRAAQRSFPGCSVCCARRDR
jgi:hypothetical protein